VIENAKPVHNPELLLTLDVQGFRAFVFNERSIANALIEAETVHIVPAARR
jgi:hypothetical protein